MKFVDYIENIDIYAEAIKAIYNDRTFLNGRINYVASAKPAAKDSRRSQLNIKKLIYGHTKELRPKLRRMINRVSSPSVSVCIPTFRANSTLFRSIDSALGQRCVPKLEVVVIVNGNNNEWACAIKDRYSGEQRVRVATIGKKGAAAARNEGVRIASNDFISFLDDDDYFTNGYLSALIDCIHPKSDIVCGWFTNVGSSDESYGYLNKALSSLRKTGYKNPNLTGVFSTVAGKLYRKSFLDNCKEMNEDLRSSEDIVFWAENYELLRKRVASPSAACGESYIRVVTEDSVSRPTDAEAFTFYVPERLKVISELEKVLFQGVRTGDGRKFVLGLIRAQERMIAEFYDGLDHEARARAQELVYGYDGLLLNRGHYAKKVGLAFCHNFSPAVDASAMVASKRLRQLERQIGEPLEWHVFSKNMSDIRKSDPAWQEYYVKPIIASDSKVSGKTSESPRSQFSYAVESYIKAASVSASYVYSRSAFPGSHIAAYLYKKSHPEVTWIAEFSDPIALDTFERKRSAFYSDNEFEDFFEACEVIPYRHADTLIFTNNVQKEYMLSYCEDTEAAQLAASKSLVWHHPVIAGQYVHLFSSSYSLNDKKINIGYFGSFYARRNIDPLLCLARRADIEVHLFVPKPSSVKVPLPNNVKLNGVLPYFEFLDVAGKMDYVFLSDMEPLESGITPWLPSKLSDYLATDTPVIACCNEGSPLWKYQSAQILKVMNIDSGFLGKLVKKNSQSSV